MIASIETVDISDLQPNPENPRKISAEGMRRLKKKLERFGNLGDLVARRLPDGSLRIVSGHQRSKALMEMGIKTASCRVIECSDQDERALMVALNGHDGEWEKSALDTLVEQMSADGEDLATLGIGDPKAIDDLASSAKSVDVKPIYEVVVQCAGEDEQREVYERLTEEGLTCRVLTI
jgi:ParB-like chromosome segregation protein Spo0J